MTNTTASGDPAATPESFSNAEIESLFLSAARDGQTDLVTEFVKAGLDPDIRNDKGHTALILAAYNGHAETVRALLAAGAKPDLRDGKGSTALAGVAFKGDLPCARILLDHGAGIDVPNHIGRTPLIFAAMFNRDSMVTFLLEHGADPDLCDGEGISARIFATRQGNTALLAAMDHTQAAAQAEHPDLPIPPSDRPRRPRRIAGGAPSFIPPINLEFSLMSRFWSPVVHNLTPYVPGEQPRLANLIKLNTNECPYGPSPRALAAIRAATDDTLRLYPDPTAHALCAAIARAHDVPADHVFVGNGSDEVLAHAFQGLLNHEDPLLFPDISYSFYPVYCGLYGIRHETVALDGGMRIDIAAYRRPCGGIIIPNPNAPTGMALPLSEIRALLADHPDAVVVIDEAYVDFGAETAVALVARHPNLLVVRTLSKSSALAGLRVATPLASPT